MNQFKKQMMSFHMQEKNCLNRLYIDKQIYLSSVRSSERPVEEEKIYVYKDLSFQFMGTGFRTPQKLILLVFLPEHLISGTYPIVSYPVAYEDYVLGILADSVNHLSEEYQNDKKSARDKAQFRSTAKKRMYLFRRKKGVSAAYSISGSIVKWNMCKWKSRV